VYCIFKNIAGTLWAACSRVLEKLIVTQIGRNFLFFYGAQRFITKTARRLYSEPDDCISHPKIQHNKGEKGEVVSFKVMNAYGGVEA